MDTLERLLAIEEIKQLKARYFRCIDTKDWAGLVDVFAPDAVMDMTAGAAGGKVTTGAEEIARYVQRSGRLDEAVTVHHGHMPEIAMTSADTATGIWSMEDEIWWNEGAFPLASLHGYGHYHETYVRQGGTWRIATLRLTRLRVDSVTR